MLLYRVHPFGLSASQFGVLDTVATRGAVHQQEIAEALGRSKAQMTAIIDALAARDLVRRERHATDRRYITVHLTDAGGKMLELATPARSAAIIELMSELTGEQKSRLARLCRRLLRVLDPNETDRDESTADDDVATRHGAHDGDTHRDDDDDDDEQHDDDTDLPIILN